MSDFSIAIILVVVAAVLVWLFLKYKANSSERRMMQMLQRTGLDPAIATGGNTEAIIKEVRRRCRRCESEGPCERWLEGLEKGENDFCPNAEVFEELKRASAA
jgi:hypothetical protein